MLFQHLYRKVIILDDEGTVQNLDFDGVDRVRVGTGREDAFADSAEGADDFGLIYHFVEVAVEEVTNLHRRDAGIQQGIETFRQQAGITATPASTQTRAA